MAEEIAQNEGTGRGTAFPDTKPLPINEVTNEAEKRMSCGISEFDRVLGGGLVAGSLVLIGGDPGIGKSTLLLQATNHIAKNVGSVL